MMAGKAPGTVSWKEELEGLVVLHSDAQRNEAWHLGRELVAEGKPVGSFQSSHFPGSGSHSVLSCSLGYQTL